MDEWLSEGQDSGNDDSISQHIVGPRYSPWIQGVSERRIQAVTDGVKTSMLKKPDAHWTSAWLWQQSTTDLLSGAHAALHGSEDADKCLAVQGPFARV